MRLRSAAKARCRREECVPKPEPVVRKPRGYDLVSARGEAPSPWGVGGRDDAEMHLLDANG